MKTLEHVLTDVECVAADKDLKFELETKLKDGTGARVSIRYVKSQNNIMYTHMLINGISNSPKGLADIIEEEVILEITTQHVTNGRKEFMWHADWTWNKHLVDDKSKKKSAIKSAILDITHALNDRRAR